MRLESEEDHVTNGKHLIFNNVECQQVITHKGFVRVI